MNRILAPKEAKAYLERLLKCRTSFGSNLRGVVFHFLLSTPMCNGLVHSLEHRRSEPN